MGGCRHADGHFGTWQFALARSVEQCEKRWADGDLRLWRLFRLKPEATRSIWKLHHRYKKRSEAREPLDAHQRVVRIEMIDVVAGDELVLDEDGRRDGAPAQQVEGEADDAFAVSLREVAD